MWRELILKDGLRMPGGWKSLELAKELCLRTMARLRGFQSREWKLERAMWTIQFSACSWDSSLSREEFLLPPNSENPWIFVSGSPNTVYRPQIRRLTFILPGQTWEDISYCFFLHRLLMKAVLSLIPYGVKPPWRMKEGDKPSPRKMHIVFHKISSVLRTIPLLKPSHTLQMKNRPQPHLTSHCGSGDWKNPVWTQSCMETGPYVGIFSLETLSVAHLQTELGKETESFSRRLQQGWY